jgi:hypothetical protein
MLSKIGICNHSLTRKYYYLLLNGFLTKILLNNLCFLHYLWPYSHGQFREYTVKMIVMFRWRIQIWELEDGKQEIDKWSEEGCIELIIDMVIYDLYVVLKKGRFWRCSTNTLRKKEFVISCDTYAWAKSASYTK